MKLRPSQKEMLFYSIGRSTLAYFVDPRVGKTLPAVEKARMVLGEGRALIVGPDSTLYGWEATLRAQGENGIVYLTGKKEKRIERLQDTEGRWFLINKEGWLVIGEQLRAIDWAVVYLDESRFIASPSSGVSEFFTKNFRTARLRGIFTGTPAVESDLEYFQQLKFLDPNILGYKNFYDWQYAKFIQIDYDKSWVMRREYRPVFADILAKNTCMIKRVDVRGITEKAYELRKIDMDAATRIIYEKAETDFVLEVDGVEIKETKFDIVKFSWLRRLCSGMVDDRIVWDGKIKALLEILLGEFRGLRAVVWCSLIDELKAVATALQGKGAAIGVIYGQVKSDERESIRKRFNSGLLDYVVGQPGCFRFGTDLSGGDLMVYFSQPFGGETRIQSEDREISLDKSTPITIIDLVVRRTIDEDMHRTKKYQLKRSESLREIARAIVARRRENE